MGAVEERGFPVQTLMGLMIAFSTQRGLNTCSCQAD